MSAAEALENLRRQKKRKRDEAGLNDNEDQVRPDAKRLRNNEGEFL